MATFIVNLFRLSFNTLEQFVNLTTKSVSFHFSKEYIPLNCYFREIMDKK